MPIVSGREYRSIQIDNFTANDDEEYIVEGYATTFDDPYQMYEDWDGNPIYECISSRALDGADTSDVIFQYDHSGLVMARNRNNTLSFLPDAHGLYVRASLKGTERGRQLHEAIKNGLVDRMSWAFTVAKDGWEWNEKTRTSTITKIKKVYDVSAVSVPANEGTEIKARSYLDGVIEKEHQELVQRSKERDLILARLRLSRLEMK